MLEDRIANVRVLLKKVATDVENGVPIDRKHLASSLRDISDILGKASFGDPPPVTTSSSEHRRLH